MQRSHATTVSFFLSSITLLAQLSTYRCYPADTIGSTRIQTPTNDITSHFMMKTTFQPVTDVSRRIQLITLSDPYIQDDQVMI